MCLSFLCFRRQDRNTGWCFGYIILPLADVSLASNVTSSSRAHYATLLRLALDYSFISWIDKENLNIWFHWNRDDTQISTSSNRHSLPIASMYAAMVGEYGITSVECASDNLTAILHHVLSGFRIKRQTRRIRIDWSYRNDTQQFVLHDCKSELAFELSVMRAWIISCWRMQNMISRNILHDADWIRDDATDSRKWNRIVRIMHFVTFHLIGLAIDWSNSWKFVLFGWSTNPYKSAICVATIHAITSEFFAESFDSIFLMKPDGNLERIVLDGIAKLF